VLGGQIDDSLHGVLDVRLVEQVPRDRRESLVEVTLLGHGVPPP